MREELQVGGLYQLSESERAASKSEFCLWTHESGEWNAARGFIDVKPFQQGLVCVDVLKDRKNPRGRSQRPMSGIFLAGDKFVAIGIDYIERVA